VIFPPPVTLPYTKPAALFAFREGVLFLFLAKNVQLPSYHITFSLFVNGFGAKSNANPKFRNLPAKASAKGERPQSVSTGR
jgi:hypothetical protein